MGEKIRKRRKELGLTLKEVAGDFVTVAQLSSIENGKSKPSKKLLEFLAKQLGVNIEYFIISEHDAAHIKFNDILLKSKAYYNDAKYEEALNYFNSARPIFNILSNLDKGIYYTFIGDCLYSMGEYEQSFENFNKALVYYLRTVEYNLIADINIKIGNSLYMAKNYEIALGYYLNALSYIDKLSDLSITARIFYDLSLCYFTLDRFGLSREYLEKCIEYIKMNDLETKSNLLPYINMMIGLINLKLDNVKESLEEFNQAFEKYKLQNDIVGMARAKNNIGICLRELGQSDKAIECFKEALEYKVISNDEDILEPVRNLIEIYSNDVLYDNIIDILNNAESIFIKRNDYEGLINIYLLKMDFFIKHNDFDKSEIYGFLALDNALRKNNKQMLEKVYLNLSKLYRKIGNESMTIEYMLKAKD
ncbi:tetratricopeptide repeat protein [Caloramator mitchellensis]|nr:tetratricopeptide repeat protein [Caloramator mitchellensis]